MDDNRGKITVGTVSAGFERLRRLREITLTNNFWKVFERYNGNRTRSPNQGENSMMLENRNFGDAHCLFQELVWESKV